MKKIISPIQILSEKMNREALIVRIMADLLKLHKEFIEKIEVLNKIGPKGDKGDRGERGERGFDGKNGEKPVKGVDYFTPQELNEMIAYIESRVKVKTPTDGKTPIKGVDYFTQEEKDELIDIISSVVALKAKPKDDDDESLLHVFTKKGKKLSMKHIDGLEQTISAFSNQLGRSGYIHGGGDTVVAGSGITLTSNSNGTKVISVSGVGSSTVTPPEDANGTNTTFTFATKPKLVFVDGGRAVQETSKDGTTNWSYAGTTLTMIVAPNFDIFALL